MELIKTNNIYKVLDHDGRTLFGGEGRWSLPRGDQPGEWMPDCKLLHSDQAGYHLCLGEHQLVSWLGPEIWLAEFQAYALDSYDCIVVGRARLLRKLETWNEDSAKRFAAGYAKHAMRFLHENHWDYENTLSQLQRIIQDAEVVAGRSPSPRPREAYWVAALRACCLGVKVAQDAARHAFGLIGGAVTGSAMLEKEIQGTILHRYLYGPDAQPSRPDDRTVDQLITINQPKQKTDATTNRIINQAKAGAQAWADQKTELVRVPVLSFRDWRIIYERADDEAARLDHRLFTRTNFYLMYFLRHFRIKMEPVPVRAELFQAWARQEGYVSLPGSGLAQALQEYANRRETPAATCRHRSPWPWENSMVRVAAIAAYGETSDQPEFLSAVLHRPDGSMMSFVEALTWGGRDKQAWETVGEFLRGEWPRAVFQDLCPRPPEFCPECNELLAVVATIQDLPGVNLKKS